MAAITAAMVKELREKTSAGMMDCKKALQECDGDLNNAVDWLRQKGLSKAAKKAGRATSEGLVGCYVSEDGKLAGLAELKCETDFVSRNEKFIALSADLAKQVATTGSLDEAAQASVNDIIATLGENMAAGRTAQMAVAGTGAIGSYVHSNGKIAVLVNMTFEKAETAANEVFQECAKNIAMQIAASNPAALSPEKIDAEVIERERGVYRQKALDEGKPENIVEKIVDGAIKKFYKEACLLEQAYIRDDKMSINDLLTQTGKAVGDSISITDFVRFQLGEDAAAESEEA
ncbi:translation elongation factor Ts [Oleidesulfovibrio sp.]|uniref:translation elongation factor Ts n=1 Tax=Oleidesulfovibrio sp. TaxID=2909707 RepID=UPI003A85D96E